ncbi:hypothetical protein OD91_0297 [Lutibacter sp. Hel_I_33_5]|uniref:hypothetical protein n=1 Tax=Lutibacter sp. Hel_I_33_5 TaxID=1566289 RepID=UPI00119CF6C2|nr:hypothetical protein [Lutibacter sp. Hel_I_33_5]TVZ55056.1 hypothetical protein OD91_0297 [Lutibacter sp. Hel_I_33_5]
MKKFKLIIAIIAISMSTTFSASANDNDKRKSKKVVKTELRTQIINLLGTKMPFQIDKNVSAKISFLLNNSNEVVIISVDSNNETVNSFVKSKLNYQTVKVEGIKKGEIYKVPLKVKQS